MAPAGEPQLAMGPQPAPVMAAAPRMGDLDTFEGGGGVERWLFQAKQYMDLRSLYEPSFASDQFRQMYAATRLRGVASDWWRSVLLQNNGNNPYGTFAEWCQALANQCLPVDNETFQRRRLEKLYQNRAPVSSYIRKFREISMSIPRFQYDGEGLARFKEHLDPSLRAKVELQRPNTLQQAMELAQAAEANDFERRNRYSVFSEYQGEFAPGLPSAGRQQLPTPMEIGAITCYICERPGHKASVCPFKSSIRCSRCGRTGHNAKRCQVILRSSGRRGGGGGDTAGTGGPRQGNWRTH